MSGAALPVASVYVTPEGPTCHWCRAQVDADGLAVHVTACPLLVLGKNVARDLRASKLQSDPEPWQPPREGITPAQIQKRIRDEAWHMLRGSRDAHALAADAESVYVVSVAGDNVPLGRLQEWLQAHGI